MAIGFLQSTISHLKIFGAGNESGGGVTRESVSQPAVLYSPHTAGEVVAGPEYDGARSVEVEGHHGGVTARQCGFQLGRDSLAEFPDFDFPVGSSRGKESACRRLEDKGW